MHFFMDLLLIRDHFIIVIWQKYLLLSGLRNRDMLMEVPFLAYPNILNISIFNGISIIGVEPKKGFSSTKIQIRDHFTIDTFAILLL